MVTFWSFFPVALSSVVRKYIQTEFVIVGNWLQCDQWGVWTMGTVKCSFSSSSRSWEPLILWSWTDCSFTQIVAFHTVNKMMASGIRDHEERCQGDSVWDCLSVLNGSHPRLRALNQYLNDSFPAAWLLYKWGPFNVIKMFYALRQLKINDKTTGCSY